MRYHVQHAGIISLHGSSAKHPHACSQDYSAVKESSSPLRAHEFHEPGVRSQEFSANEISATCRQPGFSAMLAHARILSRAACCLSLKKQLRNSLSPACLHVRNMTNTTCNMVNTMIATKIRELCLMRQFVRNPFGLVRMCLL